jgi:hypothetical protein
MGRAPHAERDLSGYAAGHCTERIGEGGHVPAGMCWILLTHGGRKRLREV